MIAGGNAGQYPPDNFFPASLDEVGFVDRGRGDYRLAASSRFRSAGTDSRDPGVDFDALARGHVAGRSASALSAAK